MNWIKNVGVIPPFKLVHIQLNTTQDNGIDYDVRYNQNPDRWDWYTRSGVQILSWALP